MSIKRFCSAACGLFFLLVCAISASPPGPPVASSQTLPLDTATATSTAGPNCLTITASTPRCYWPNTINYYFAFYNSCNTGLTGSGTVQLELAATSGGPWIVYDQASVNQAFPPGSSYASGNFIENNIPTEYHYYRFTITLNTSNGQTLNGTTVYAPLCNTPGTPIPTPTGITIRCYMGATGAQSTCSQPDTYSYDFGIYSHCDTTMPGTVQLQFQVSASQGGPWTTYDTQTSSRTYSPGVNTVQGTFIEGAIPPQYQWYRMTMSASYPGPFGSRYVTNETQPASICTVNATATVTPTVSPTQPASPTVSSCLDGYNYTVSSGTIVSGTTLLPGSQCGVCVVNVALPFPVTFYGQTYTSANLSTQGNLQFTTTQLGQNACPLPEPLLGSAMMPHWDEWLETSYHFSCQAAMGSDCGIYTSVSGTAPNRIFNIEWRARYKSTSQHTANFEIRLYENSTYFEYLYGWISYFGGYATIGVQDGSCFTTYSCNAWNYIQPGRRIGWGGPSGTPTPTAQATTSPTIGPPCGIITLGNPGTTYCTSASSYFYSFTFYVESGCPATMNGTATVTFEVAPNPSGPWTAYDATSYPVTFQRGWNGATGSFVEPAIPPQYQWYRVSFGARFPNNVNAYSVTDPVPLCNQGTVTPTTTTPTATPASCSTNYSLATATATIVPGTVDTGNHCDDCSTQITLPFSYQLYDQSFSVVSLESNGSASFPTGASVFPTECLPQTAMTYTIFPYWGDDLRTDCAGCGIYTSVSGTVPNRILNIEWRTEYFAGAGTANFEVRLYEGQTRFDVIYGVVTAGNASAEAGVQKNSTYWTQYFCNGQGGDANNGRLVIYTLTGCGTPTITGTATSIATFTYTPSPVTSTTPDITHTAIVTATPISCDISFSDVPVGHTFYPNVRCLACRDIVSGYSDGTFRPNNQVTRGQLAKIVSNAAGFTEPVSGQTFQDVPPNHTFYEFIQRLTNRGYMTGYACGGPGEPCVNNRPYFRPFANATRGQTSKIVSNAAGFTESHTSQIFQDVPPIHTFYQEIERLASRGVMGGYPCGGPGEPCVAPENRPYFRPGNDVTRGQSAKIVANTFFPGCDTP